MSEIGYVRVSAVLVTMTVRLRLLSHCQITIIIDNDFVKCFLNSIQKSQDF